MVRTTRAGQMRVLLTAISAMAVVAFLAVPAAAQDPRTEVPEKTPKALRLLMSTDYGKDMTLRRYEPLRAHLADSLDQPVELLAFPNPDAALTHAATGEFDLAYFYPLAYVQASRSNELEPLVSEFYYKDREGYHSIIIARRSSKQEKPRVQKGLVLAFTSPHSTSGYLMPLYYFHNVIRTPPASYAAEVVFAGSHKAVIKGVLDGTYDVGATNDVDLEALMEAGEVPADAFVTLWVSRPIPGSVYAAPKSAPTELKRDFKKAMLALNAHQRFLDGLGVAGYSEAEPEDYEIMFKLSEYYLK